jgi:serine/threonine-protein kinase
MDELIADLDKLVEGSVPAAVGEMMARSGGFNVPADYFKKAQMPALVPATPIEVRTKSRWPLVAGFAGVLAAVAIVVAIFAKSGMSQANNQLAAARSAPAHKPNAAELPSAAPSGAVVSPEGLAMKQVVLAAEPLDAHVWRGETDLGQSPVVIDVADGQTVEVELRRGGFKSQNVFLDGTIPREVVKLERIAGPSSGRPPAGKVEKPEKPGGKKKGGNGGGEIVNPWD